MAIRIKSKNSVVKDKAPLPADLEIGELALNAHQDSPAIYLKDAAGAIRKVAGAGAVAADATTTAKGVVQLADAAAITAGTAGRVVDAAQLKAVSDADDWTRTGTTLSPTNAGDLISSTDGSRTALLGTDGAAPYLGTAGSPYPFLFKVGDGTVDVERARLTEVGDLLIGGTPAAPSIALKADGSANFTGAPKAPTAAPGTNTTQLATTAFVKAAIDGADDWTRTGTTIAPRVAGDVVTISAGTPALPGLTPVGDPNTGLYSPGADQVGIATNGIARLLTDATGGVTVTGLNGASIANLAVSTTGKLIRQALPFTWDANDDSYSRVPVADRSILVQARMKRCLLTNAGVATYLDADDSTKLAGDWVRLVETTELSVAYTGTHGAEVANTELRGQTPAWAAGTFTKGALVSHGGFVWECVAATTTATPAAGTAAATLTGATAQVMVEVPLFSIRHAAPKVGAYRRHELSVALGVVQGGGYAVHPAFVKPDGTYRNFFYVGAYQGTGANGNGSASGVNNAVNFTRAAARAAMAGRGAGWHQMSYYQYSALAALLFAEYQDFESQRCLGNGATTGSVYVVPTGLSNARGNRSANAHTPSGANSDYVSYRGVENIYGRAWQWVDGWNINERMCYLTGDPASFADNTASKYQPAGMVPSGSGSFIRDIKEGAIFLADSVAGGSGTTFTGDGLWTNSGWRVACVGSGADDGAQVGALYAVLSHGSTVTRSYIGGRICYAP